MFPIAFCGPDIEGSFLKTYFCDSNVFVVVLPSSESELHNVNFFTQIISVQLNLPQEKARKLREVFDIFNGHKKLILGQTYQKLHLEDCFEEKCHCSC